MLLRVTRASRLDLITAKLTKKLFRIDHKRLAHAESLKLWIVPIRIVKSEDFCDPLLTASNESSSIREEFYAIDGTEVTWNGS